MGVTTEEKIPDAKEPAVASAIAHIQRKVDGSYIIVCNGYPYHATPMETPAVYQQVTDEIERGAPVTEYVEPGEVTPDPLAQAIMECSRLRAVADYAIAPLQDAVDVDEATDADIAALKAWKKYRVGLSRVPEQLGYPTSINWPIVPV